MLGDGLGSWIYKHFLINCRCPRHSRSGVEHTTATPVLNQPQTIRLLPVHHAELEREEGDVLINKQRVWEHAEEQAALFRTWVKNQDPFYN